MVSISIGRQLCGMSAQRVIRHFFNCPTKLFYLLIIPREKTNYFFLLNFKLNFLPGSIFGKKIVHKLNSSIVYVIKLIAASNYEMS